MNCNLTCHTFYSLGKLKVGTVQQSTCTGLLLVQVQWTHEFLGQYGKKAGRYKRLDVPDC